MSQKIPDGVKQGIVDKLLLIGNVLGTTRSYRSFFERVYPSADPKLFKEIARHCDAFPDDWGDDTGIFDTVEISKLPDEEFLFFCQQYVNPVFCRYKYDEEKDQTINLQTQCVKAINYYLSDCGYELREANRFGDKIEYNLVETAGVSGSIQGIVFAATGKPDLLLTDVLNQSVSIPQNEDKYLLYEEAIGIKAFTWKELVDWFEMWHLPDETCMERLWKSVRHCGSPIEELFFSAYLELAELYSDKIPALLPQVYLYYDSKTQKDRTIKVFDHQCMDFLMLFSESSRVVIELDGVQHYAEDEEISIPGRGFPIHAASTSRYASMVSAQRDMTLAGYEVYRFGGKELHEETSGKHLVKQFLRDLCHAHGIELI